MAIQMKLKGVINQHECGHVELNIGFIFLPIKNDTKSVSHIIILSLQRQKQC